MRIQLPMTDINCETLIDVLKNRAVIQADVLAFRFLRKDKEPETITYKSLDRKARAIAATLQHRGIKMGDRVILIYPPGLDLIAAYFGCLYAGAIAVPVYPPFNSKLVEKLQSIIKNSEAKILLSTTIVTQQLRQLKFLKLLIRMPVLKQLAKRYLAKYSELTQWDLEKFSWMTTDDIPLSQVDNWKQLMISADHIAFLQYTSGSTGHPKGVMVSHENLLHNLSLIRQGFNVAENSVGVSWLPPYHDMGLIGGILQPLFSGVPSILMSPLYFLRNPLAWLKTISDFQVTTSGGPNFAYNYCVDKIREDQKVGLDLSSWKLAFNGAEPIRAETLERFYEAFKNCHFQKEAFYSCYGLAEATLIVSGTEYFQGYHVLYVSDKALKEHYIKLVNAADSDAKPLVSCGHPLQEVRIVDPDTHQLCKADVVGEIWVNSPSVAKGYWQRPEETQETFNAHIVNDENHISYLRTGDLGFIIEGNLYIAGRLKDLIIIYGINHYPQDIEYTADHCHPSIRSGNCAAFSIEENGKEHLALVCEVKEETLKDNYEDIFTTVKQAIAKHHALTLYTFVLLPPKTLPKTTSGKVQRNATRQALQEGAFPMLKIWKGGPK